MYKISNTIDNEIKSAIDRCSNYTNGRIFSYTFMYNLDDLLPILSNPKDKDNYRIYWEQKMPNVSFAGLNYVCNLNIEEFSNINQFNNQIKQELDNLISISSYKDIGPIFIGGNAFSSDKKTNSVWGDFPRGKYILPEFLATKTDDGSWITISRRIYSSDDYESTIKSFKDTYDSYHKRLIVTLPKIKTHTLIKFINIPSKTKYCESISSIIKKINTGELEKVVISRLQQVKTDTDFCIISALQILRSFYLKCTNYFFNFPGEGLFFGSTPERLLRKYNEVLTTEAIAGSIQRGLNLYEDNLYSSKLLNSNKELNEHQLVINQIIEKLKPIVLSITTSPQPYILKLKNVQHLKSVIDTEIDEKLNIFDLIQLLHPTPAVAGTPMNMAINTIKQNESHDRGWYSGPIGWIDNNGNGDIFVALRSALQKANNIYIFSGSGIVLESISTSEWDETEMKLQPILTSLLGEKP